MNSAKQTSSLARHPVFIGVNLEIVSHDFDAASDQGFFGRFSHGRYALRQGIWTLLQTFDAEGVKATFFTDPHDAIRYPHLIEAIILQGHEVGMLGPFGHDGLDSGRRLDEIDAAAKMLRSIAGEEVCGWRSANGLVARETLVWLAANGFRYDSSFYDDDRPYVFGTTSTGGHLAELPIFEYLTDTVLYGARHTTSTIEKIWSEELEAMLDANAYLAMTLSGRADTGSGRGSRAVTVSQWISKAARKPGVEFYPARVIADDALLICSPEAIPSLLL